MNKIRDQKSRIILVATAMALLCVSPIVNADKYCKKVRAKVSVDNFEPGFSTDSGQQYLVIDYSMSPTPDGLESRFLGKMYLALDVEIDYKDENAIGQRRMTISLDRLNWGTFSTRCWINQMPAVRRVRVRGIECGGTGRPCIGEP